MIYLQSKVLFYEDEYHTQGIFCFFFLKLITSNVKLFLGYSGVNESLPCMS